MSLTNRAATYDPTLLARNLGEHNYCSARHCWFPQGPTGFCRGHAAGLPETLEPTQETVKLGQELILQMEKGMTEAQRQERRWTPWAQGKKSKRARRKKE